MKDEEPITPGRDAVYIGRDADGKPIPYQAKGLSREEYAARFRRAGMPEEKIAHLLSLRFSNS